ncbi:UPF0147 family protein [Candidatus Woesearchaeota archaeon]|nr:UPF0147 family protein [Candidatus Woesearchaeota archaeon]
MTGGVNLKEILEIIQQIKQDPMTPRSLKEATDKIIAILKEDSPIDLRAKKCLDLLEEMGEDPNLPVYVRSQLWSLVSLFESLA